MKYLAVGVALLTWQAQALGCTLRIISNQQNLNGRIAGINLRVRHGAVTHLRNVAAGWNLTINNDPSWTTTLNGRALVGAAFLDLDQLTGLFFITPEPNYNCAEFRKMGVLRLQVKLYYNDHMHTSVVDHLTVTD